MWSSEVFITLLSALTALIGAPLAIWRIRVHASVDKLRHELALKERRAELEADKERAEQARDLKLQEHITAIHTDMQKRLDRADATIQHYDQRLTQALLDKDVHLEKRAEAEALVKERQASIDLLQTKWSEALHEAISRAEKATRLAVEKEYLERENADYKAELEDLRQRVKLIPELERKVDELTRKLALLQTAHDLSHTHEKEGDTPHV